MIDRERILQRSLSSDTQAASTAFQIAGAVFPEMRSRPRANCPLRIRWINSTPPMVVAAFPKCLNPSIGLVRDLMFR